MAIPTNPATPEQMQIEAIQELDRMRNMSLQALAMNRIRDSVMTMSRETGFRERPIEQFAQAPLFIPQYRQWSNTLGRLVGTDAPTAPVKPYIRKPTHSRAYDAMASLARDAAATIRGETVNRALYAPISNQGARAVYGRNRYRFIERERLPNTYENLRAELARNRSAGPWLNWLTEYSKWYEQQKGLPT